MHAVSWPTALLHLHCLTVCRDIDRHVLPHHYMLPLMLPSHSMSPYRCMLPDEWQHYTQLKVLCLHHYLGHSLPVWFSRLQHLNVLSMLDARMNKIPECLLQLSELKHLDLGRFQGLLTMPIVKLAIADLPQLTYLSWESKTHSTSRRTGCSAGLRHCFEQAGAKVEKGTSE